MDELKNIRVYSEVHGILGIDGMSMGETSSPLCFMLPQRRTVLSFTPLVRAKSGFYMGFSRVLDLSCGIPKVFEDDGALCITAAGETLIADIFPPFLPEQTEPPHILASAVSGRYRATVYWDRWITFAIENERGEMVYARPLILPQNRAEAGCADVFFRNCGVPVAFGAYREEGSVYAACAAGDGRELLNARCSEYSFGEKLILKHRSEDGCGSVFTEVYAVSGREAVKEKVTCEREGAGLTPETAVHALAEAVRRGCESAAMSLLAPGLRASLSMERLREFFGEVCGVERRLGGNDGAILKYPAGRHVFEGKYVKTELTGGLISNITMD